MSFVKLQRTEFVDYVLRTNHNAFALLTLVARRARRTNDINDGLEIGESLIGDPSSCDLTRGEYRVALKWLQKMKIIATKTTNKGTIVRLLDSRVYDINENDNSHQDSHQIASQQPSNSHQIATNKKIRIQEDKKEDIDNKNYLTLVGDGGGQPELITRADEDSGQGKVDPRYNGCPSPEWVKSWYNELAVENGFSLCCKMTSARIQKIKARYKDGPDGLFGIAKDGRKVTEHVAEAIRGPAGDWWREHKGAMTFDWMIRNRENSLSLIERGRAQ